MDKEAIAKYQKEYRKKNLDKYKKYQKDYQTNYYSIEENKTRIRKNQKDYYNNPVNNGRMKEYMKNYIRERAKVDPLFRFIMVTRSLIGRSIRSMGYKKNSKTEQILGCTFDRFKKHIEDRFKSGMNWLNHGEWHIDHKKPLALANTQQELIELNHYSNLQPLWASENLSKGSKYQLI